MSWWWGSPVQSYETFDYSQCKHLFQIKNEDENILEMKCSICWIDKVYNKNIS